MKRSLILTLMLTVMLMIAASIAAADVPQMINYQGRLMNADRATLDTTLGMTFAIYDDSTGADSLWSENHPSVSVKNGLFTVILGSLSPLPDSVFSDEIRYLGITIGTDSELKPRTRLVTVSYAYHSLRADTADFALSPSNGWVDDGITVRLESAMDLVGVGTVAPITPLHVYFATDNTSERQHLLTLQSHCTSTYTEGFGPEISFRATDEGGNDFEYARIAAVRDDFSDNFGRLEWGVLANGVMNTLMAYDGKRGLEINGAEGIIYGRIPAVLEVRNNHANTATAAFGSETSEDIMYLDYVNNPGPGRYFLTMRSSTSTIPDDKFKFATDGNAYADGSFSGGGADYAEWFEKEGEIPASSLIGLNVETGKMRVWQTGDPFVGVQSVNPGFVGNNVFGAGGTDEQLERDHVLVALIGQVEIAGAEIVEREREVFTTDGQVIGWRLSNGKVFLK